MKHFHRLPDLRSLSLLLALALVIPVSWGVLTGLSVWLSPFIMLNSVFTLKSLVWLNVVAFLVLAFLLYRKRWFCRYLCPVGWCCEKVSRLNGQKQHSNKGFPDINKWLAALSLSAAITGIPLFIFLDPLALLNGFFSIFKGHITFIAIVSLLGFPFLLLINLLFPDIWCNKICPLGGLQLIISDVKTHLRRSFTGKEPETRSVDTGRRYFVMSGFGLLTGAVLPKFLKPAKEKFLRPPASVEHVLFNSLCCRCGNCSKACPTGIISFRTDFNNLTGWMTPELSFKSGYCLETCNFCGRVCPSGAITLFSIEAKSQLFIGTAVISMGNCLLSKNRECIKCRESCKYGAIKLVYKENILNALPVIDKEKCVGCGACEVVCPENCIVVNPIFVPTLKEA